jgi:SpoVK/Ycf46/Vps4 family AAA+-type ATPase
VDHYPTSLDHLLAELERIDLLIRSQVAHQRALQSEDAQFQGLYISEQEVDRLLQQPAGMPGWAAPDARRPAELRQELERLATQIAQRRQQSLDRGIVLALDRLRECFALTPLDLDILLIGVAVELETRYERLYAYLQDDVTRKRPSVDLVLKLLAMPVEGRIAARARFSSTAPLRRHRLIELVDDPSQPATTMLSKYIKVDQRIVDNLLGFTDLDERIQRYGKLRSRCPPAGLEGSDADLVNGLRGLAAGLAPGKGMVLHLRGPYGAGKQRIAQALCAEQGMGLLVVDLPRLLAQPDARFGDAVALLMREARLQHAAPYWAGYDVLLGEPHRALQADFLHAVEHYRGLVFLSGESPWAPAQGSRSLLYHSMLIPRPDVPRRLTDWRTTLGDYPCEEGPADLASLASKFKFTRGQIEDAAATAMTIARRRDAEAPRIRLPDLYEACRVHSNQTLTALSRKITPKFSWGDIVLPADRMMQLRDICNHMKYRDRVYAEWGFEHKLGLGKGLAVLFAGPSGTGKTMAAEIIASELGLDLYKIDLSSVVSKYIGETEKNLARIFSEAETSNAILFFDEADALFGKRSEVRDSHDRYANIEVGYLLQRMEEYEGIAILATNFRKNMDEAFVRRLQFTVEFPFPGQEERLRIWENIWPGNSPREAELDLPSLARQFEVTGGNIRNIALGAAFLAADEGGMIGVRHLLTAIQREYQKMGKLMQEGVFKTGNKR